MAIATETSTAPVTLTEGAVKEVKKLIDQQELDETFGLSFRRGGWRLLRYELCARL